MSDVKLADCRVLRCGMTAPEFSANHAHDADCWESMSEADLDSLIRERGVTDEMMERGRFPILDTTAMFASKMLGITHEEAMEREDIQRMSSIVARAALEAALIGAMSKTTLTDLCFHQGGIEPHRSATTQDLIEAVESIGGRIMEVGPFGNPGRWLILRLDDSDG